MSIVAILGAGPIGSAVAHRLAQRGRVREIRLVDANVAVASGKVLDILQSGPVENFDTAMSATDNPLAAAGADAIVVADAADGREWAADEGVAMLRPIAQGGATAPIVFAGPSQLPTMERVWRELRIAPDRLVATAPAALAGAIQAVTALELGLASIDIALVGRPKAFVIVWSSASANGLSLVEHVPAHRQLSISGSVNRLWPPGPFAIGSATARVVEGLLFGSRQLQTGAIVLDGALGARGTAVALPLVLGRGRVLRHVLPSLSPQELTELQNAVAAGG